MGDEDARRGDGPDPRVEWLRVRVSSALKFKDEKFDKLMTSEDGQVLLNFLDSSDTTRMLIFDNGKGDLSAVRRSKGWFRPPHRPTGRL